MTHALKITFEDYLSLEPDSLPEGRFEYVNGELRALPPESEPNNWICRCLFLQLANANLVSARLIVTHSCEVEVPVLQDSDPRTRIPDLVILRPEHLALTRRRLTITRDMPPPVLIAEVVSSGNANEQRDYERKREQYQELGVLEYWLIEQHPILQVITVLASQNGLYREVGVFRGGNRIISPLFPDLTLTAEQVLNPDC
ncbi:Uma2 family endonuclease [Leptolyngbya sp. NK1-12]|uniref:Uma2 family endonuclease n=1 Tax=Leptolyngbya sp. NK1-12 TaxID=2547451 RepID=A0AA96WEV3_9CYAN|nr:Uma2 family endonuclease [Leptolyngbya sp. NK1-12]WNZ23300.1 Uma2 family endonuclease [Leptolyngbya sp. NK1-12]